MKLTSPHKNNILIIFILTLYTVLSNPIIAAEQNHTDNDWKKDLPKGAISETPPLVYGTPGNDGGLFLGTGLSFGQATASEGGGSAGLVAFINAELGYSFRRDSWARVITSLKLISGSVNFRHPENKGGKIKLTVPMGFLVKIGSGYSLGNGLFGVAYLGAGSVFGKYSANANNTEGSSDLNSGLLFQVGYDLVAPINKTIDVVGGLSIGRLMIDGGKIDVNDKKVSPGFSQIATNLIQLELGLRFTL